MQTGKMNKMRLFLMKTLFIGRKQIREHPLVSHCESACNFAIAGYTVPLTFDKS